MFQFLVNGSEVSNGYQQIVFAGHDKRIKRLPEDVLATLKAYELASAALRS